MFYMGRPLDRLFVPAPPSEMLHDQTHSRAWQPKPSWNVWQYLAQSPDHYAITSEQYLQSIGGLRDDVEVVARTSYFLQEDTLLLIRLQAPGSRVQGPGFRLQASGFRLQASPFRMHFSPPCGRLRRIAKRFGGNVHSCYSWRL